MLYGRLTAPLLDHSGAQLAPAGVYVVLDDNMRIRLLGLEARVEITDKLPDGAELIDLMVRVEVVTDRMQRGAIRKGGGSA